MMIVTMTCVCHYGVKTVTDDCHQGALSGAVCGLAFSLWLSVGAYVTKTLNFKLATSTRGCNVTSNVTTETMATTYVTSTSLAGYNHTTFSPSDPDQL